MLTRRQFFANSLATVAGVSLAEWILTPISHASDDKDTVQVIQYDDSGQKVGPIRVKKVRKTDDEWRQQLTPLQFEVTRKRARKERLQANTSTCTTRVCIAASVATTRYLARTPSSNQGPGGRVFGPRLRKRMSGSRLTPA
jgi:hypothetical protein